MFKNSINPTFENIREYVQALFYESEARISTGQFRPCVIERKYPQPTKPSETTPGAEFGFKVNLFNFEIEEVYGVRRWLGYPEKEFTLKLYWDQVLHAGEKKALLLIARPLYERLLQGTSSQFMARGFIVLVALKHYKGHYIFARKNSFIDQYDPANKSIIYSNEFTVLGKYNGEPLSPWIYNTNGEEDSNHFLEISTNASKVLKGSSYFSHQELEIACMLAQNANITQAEMAIKLTRLKDNGNEKPIKKVTISTLCKRFLKKANGFYRKKFSSALEAALHLKTEGLLSE